MLILMIPFIVDVGTCILPKNMHEHHNNSIRIWLVPVLNWPEERGGQQTVV